MLKKKDLRRQRDIDMLTKFRELVLSWRKTHSATYRTEINKMLPHVRELMTLTKANKFITLNAPPMMGGQRVLENVNALDLIFDCPFNQDVTPYVIDECDMALGVLNSDRFSYPEDVKNITQNTTINKKSKKVFIVHGHDTYVRNEVELFIRCIGYEPIILCKRADKGDTIIEKIEREAKDVCFAIVIYTSCDLGKDKNADDLKPRARQNVVFEHGFMCAHLGRQRVCALLEDGVEQPGDLQGVIYKPLDEGGVWKYQIADEMKAVGLDVDKNII